MKFRLPDKLRNQWRQFQKREPGNRFQETYRERAAVGKERPWRKWLVIALGVCVCLLGLVLMPAPGPGIIILIGGLLLIAEESLSMAKFLDWAEVKLRPPFFALLGRWRRLSPRTRGVLVITGSLAGAAFAAASTWYMFMR